MYNKAGDRDGRTLPVEFQSGFLSPLVFVMGSVGLAYFLWSLMTGDLGRPITDAVGMFAGAFGCTLIGLNGMYPRSPSAPKFQMAATLGMWTYIFFKMLPLGK